MKRSTFGVLTAVLSVGTMLLAAGSASGAVIYTTESSFQAAIAPGYYLEEFSACGSWGLHASPASFGPVNGWQYDVSTSWGGLWGLNSNKGGGGCISTEWPDPLLTITPTGSQQVTAIGGWFFATDWDGAVMAATIHVELSDGTILSYTSSASAYDFRGFTSTVPITSLSISIPGNPHDKNYYGAYPSLDHVYIGVPVPEPATLAILAMGFVSLIRNNCRLPTRP